MSASTDTKEEKEIPQVVDESSKVEEESQEIPPVESESSEKTTEAEAETKAPIDPPTKPSRPLSPTAKIIKELQDAFPAIEEKYIKMALIASQGTLDPAFNALLYLSDPSSDIPIPTPVTKPKLPSREAVEKRNQLESDEALAKRLAREFEKGSNKSRYPTNATLKHAAGRQAPPKPAKKPIWNRDDEFDDTPYTDKYGVSDDEPDFIDSVSKGVDEAKVKISGWFGNIAKSINDTTQQAQSSAASKQLFSAFGGNRSSEESARQSYRPNRPARRQPSSRNSEDAGLMDDEVYSNRIQMNDNESKKKMSDLPPRPARPSRKATEESAKSEEKESVAAPVESSKETESEPVPAPSTEEEPKEEEKKDSKWTNLTSVAPQPVGDDTFLVDDSDEDDDEDEDPKSKK